MKQALSQQELADELLDSEHYGERWAIPWLDQVRYADSDGYEKDQVRPHAWRYRHWVINALNEDMPFDQFTIEQLAGDLLPDASTEQRVATGFYRNTLKNREGGVDVEQFWFEEVVDRINVVGTVWLGPSLECTRCHDHKYGPISHRDYYQMFAFFNEPDEVNIDAPLAGEMGPYLRAKPVFDAKVQELYKSTRYERYSGRGKQRCCGPGRTQELSTNGRESDITRSTLMLLETLVKAIEVVRSRIQNHSSSLQANEIRTRMSLVDPLLTALGWATDNPAAVTPEYELFQKRVDYALLDAAGCCISLYFDKILQIIPMQGRGIFWINSLLQERVTVASLTETYGSTGPLPGLNSLLQ